MYDIWYFYMVVCSYYYYLSYLRSFPRMIRLVPCIINFFDAVYGNIYIYIYIYIYKLQIQHDKQCTYSVALWRVRVTIVVIEMEQCVLCLLLSYMSHNNVECCTKMLLWRIYFTSNNKSSCILHIKCPTF